jgi:hypothetical protein
LGGILNINLIGGGVMNKPSLEERKSLEDKIREIAEELIDTTNNYTYYSEELLTHTHTRIKYSKNCYRCQEVDTTIQAILEAVKECMPENAPEFANWATFKTLELRKVDGLKAVELIYAGYRQAIEDFNKGIGEKK